MRIGISSRGNAWLSMGCVGWLIIGPFLLCGYALVLLVKLMVLLCVACARGIGALVAAVRT